MIKKNNYDYMTRVLGKATVYPIFVDCAETVDSYDAFWRDKFIEFSRKIFPKGISYDNQYLKFNKKKTAVLDLKAFDGNISIMTKEIMNFVKENTFLYSENDKNENKKLENRIHDEMSSIKLTWSSAGKKDRKNLISIFISNESRRLRLNSEEKESFNLFLRQGIKEGKVADNSIIVENNAIIKIETLIFCDDSRCFTLPQAIVKINRNYSRVKENSLLEKDSFISYKKKDRELSDILDKKALSRMRAINSIGM